MKEAMKQKLAKLGLWALGLASIGVSVYASYKYGREKGYDDGVADAVTANRNFLYDSRVYPDASKLVSSGLSVNWSHPIIPDDAEREWLNKDLGDDQWRVRFVVVQKPKDYDEMLKKNPPDSEMEPLKLDWTNMIKEQYPQYSEALSDGEEETEEVVG